MVFGSYALHYDAIYRKKNYEKECAYIETLFKKYARGKVNTVLDLGCGTANHMIPFARRGYRMFGVDASAQMLKLAKQKLAELNLKADLFQEKLQSFQLNRKFDSVLCLFSVIDYITQKKDLSSALNNISGHMEKTSLFIFDFWNESAVEGYYSPTKRNVFKVNGKVLERFSSTKVYPSKKLCEVKYTCSWKQNGQSAKSVKETHMLRYFTIEEMESYLKAAGLNVIDVHPFLNIGGKIKKNTWDVTMVAQKL